MKMLRATAVQAPAVTTAHRKHFIGRQEGAFFASEQLLARLASAKKAEYQARQVCEPLALQVCDPFDAGELTTKARMANEDAKSHRSVYDSSNNCTLQASNA